MEVTAKVNRLVKTGHDSIGRISLKNKLLQIIRDMLPQHHFARGVSVLAGGTLGSQLLVVAATPIITRLYSPEDFGVLAVYGGLLTLFGIISTMRYSFAIPLPAEDEDAVDIALLCLLLVSITTLLCSIPVILAAKPIALILGVPQIEGYLWLLPFGIFTTGIFQIFRFWAIRIKVFSPIATSSLRQSFTALVIRLSASSFGAGTLIASQVAGQIVGVVSIGFPILRHPRLKKTNSSNIIKIAKRYKKFPIFSTGASFLNSAGVQLPALMFASLFNPAAAGLYAVTFRVLLMPITVVGDAVSNVFRANAAEAYHEGRLGPLVSKVHHKLTHIAMPPLLLLALIGPEFFAFVLGDRWYEAGLFARWMTPWFYVIFVTAPLRPVFEIMEKQQKTMLFECVLIAARITSIIVGAALGDLMLTVQLFSTASAICVFSLLVWVVLTSGNTWISICRPTLESFAWAVGLVLPVVIGKFLSLSFPPLSALLVISASLTGLRYGYIYRRAFL
jgi:O-antigen/teichoic acid export membrane protein